jgi:hypothetical protein
MKLSLSEKEIVSLKIQLEDKKSYLKVINELTAEQKKMLKKYEKFKRNMIRQKVNLLKLKQNLMVCNLILFNLN